MSRLPEGPGRTHAHRVRGISLLLLGLPLEPFGKGLIVMGQTYKVRRVRCFPVGALRIGA